jgi:3-deoxy-manno-octulosonate cytidylyltransferase (CMP-KDO synthetase)
MQPPSDPAVHSLSQMQRATVIIPARLGSTRFPGKVLADRTGRPLIQHVYERAAQARCAARVVIATDDERVRRAVEAFGGECILTREHPNGTSRLAEAARTLGLSADAVVVNAQGDEPELEPQLVDAAVAVLERSGAPMATAAVPFGPDEDASNPNLVKVVLAQDDTALYFSRALVPFPREAGQTGAVRLLKHVGLYVYRRSFLDEYLALPESPLENTEQLEQLRVLYHGRRIAVAVLDIATSGGIDTPEQYEAFVARWRAANR